MDIRPSAGLWLVAMLGIALAWYASGAQALLAMGCVAVAIAFLLPNGSGMLAVKTVWVAGMIGFFLYASWVDASNESKFTEDKHGRRFEISGRIASPVHVDGDRISFLLSSDWDERFQVFLYVDHEQEQREAAEWGRGDVIRGIGTLERPMEASNIDMFDYREWLRHKRIHWTIVLDGIANTRVESSGGGGPLRRLDSLRADLTDKLNRLYGARSEGVMAGLLLGERQLVDPGAESAFRTIGLAHLLAISGLHVSVFIGSLMLLGGLFRLTVETRYWICLIAVPLFVVFTGAAVPVIRAGIMAMAGLALLLRRSWKDAISLLSLTGVGMLAWNPYLLLDAGYQLSFAITAALVVGTPVVSKEITERIPSWLRNVCSVTFVAQLASFPLTIYHFNEYSLLSLPANLVVVPLVSLFVIPLGYGSLLLSLAWSPGAEAIAHVAGQVLEWTISAAEFANRYLILRTTWASPSAWWMLLFCSIIGLLLSGKLPSRAAKIATVVLLCALAVQAYEPNPFRREASVEFIDVGQGDAILVRYPSGEHWLIDAGGRFRWTDDKERWKDRRDPFEVGEDVVVPLLKARGVHRLDAVFISHGDYDHYGGLLAVLQQIEVKRVYFNGTLKDNESMRSLFAQLVRRDIPIYPVRSGMSWKPHPEAEVTALHPGGGPTDRTHWEERQNEQSIALRIRLYDAEFILPGDLDASGEREIVERFPNGHADESDTLVVLKAGHHGSESSSTTSWLAHWRPDWTVISVGAGNRYGHPSEGMLSRVSQSGSGILRTDRRGGIRFELEPGGRYRIRTALP